MKPLNAIIFQSFIVLLTWSAIVTLTEEKTWITFIISIIGSGNMFHYTPYIEWFKNQFK